MEIDWHGLEAAGIDANTPIDNSLQQFPWRKILATVLSDAGGGAANLGYAVDNDGVIQISTIDQLHSATYSDVRLYDIGSLLDVADVLQDLDFVLVVQHYSFVDSFEEIRPDDLGRNLVQAITETIAPDSWVEGDGLTGDILYFRGALLVRQSPDGHRKVADFLAGPTATARAATRAYPVADILAARNLHISQLKDLIEDLSPQPSGPTTAATAAKSNAQAKPSTSPAAPTSTPPSPPCSKSSGRSTPFRADRRVIEACLGGDGDRDVDGPPQRLQRLHAALHHPHGIHRQHPPGHLARAGGRGAKENAQ